MYRLTIHTDNHPVRYRWFRTSTDAFDAAEYLQRARALLRLEPARLALVRHGRHAHRRF